MTGRKKWVLGFVASIILIAGIGCAALSTMLTPATIDKAAVKYAASAGVIDANDFRGYGNLDKAIRLKTAVDAAFKVKELSLNQMMEKNRLDYAQLSDVAESNMKVSQAKEEQLFGPTGLLTMGLSMAGFGTLTGLVGLMRKRPGDITPQDMETAVASVKGEVTTKDRQLIEIVKGIQVVLDAHPKGDPTGDEIRKALGKQSLDTRQAVALAKTAV